MSVTHTERLILENQRLMMHALRILLSVTRAPHHQFMTMQDGMTRIERYLAEHDALDTREARRIRRSFDPAPVNTSGLDRAPGEPAVYSRPFDPDEHLPPG